MIDYLAPKKVLTPAEYFSKFVNFYGESLGAASGVQTTVDSPTDTTTPGEVPSIYDDQRGGRGDREEEARLQSESMLKDPSKGLQFFGKDDVYDAQLRKSYDFSEALGFGGDMVNADDFFGSMVDTPYGTKQSFKPSGAMGLGLGLLMGVPVPLGAMHALNMQGAAITAGKVKASGFTGGALMEINSAKVYRDPGSFQYNGNTQGMSNAQLKAMEGFQRHGYVGDWNETKNFASANRYGEELKPGDYGYREKATGTYSHSGTVGYIYENVGREDALKSGGDYDPVTGRFGFVGANGWQGAAMGTKQAAEKATRALEAKYGLPKDSFSYTNVAKARSIARATGERFDNILDGLARQQGGVTTGSSRPGFGPDFFSKERKAERASKTQATVAEQERQKRAAAEAARRAEQRAQDRAAMFRDDSGTYGGGDTGGDAGGYGIDDGKTDIDRETESFGGFESAFRSGGRVGMQAGGEAGFAQRPEFVGGNETPTNRQSIADNVPREVPEGTFVINAAAVDFAGREDIEKMVREAYAKAGQSGKAGTAQEVDIAVSEGEVIIPPHIAKIIGYDRLNKINNRGKKEISRRQAEREKKEAAGGGFISRKKFAKGDMVLPKSKPKKVNQAALGDLELRADMEEFIQTDPLARLGWNLYEKGDLDIKAIVLPSIEKVSVGIGGVYTPKDDRRDPGYVSRVFEDEAEKQGITKQNRKVAGIHYFAGENVNYGRYDATVTLLHELRHHAMRHISKKYKAPLPQIFQEEHLFDAQDYFNRIQARKVKPSIPKTSKEPELESRQEAAYKYSSANKQIAMYQEIAEQVLKDRKVPPRTKSKEVEGFFTRGMKLLGL